MADIGGTHGGPDGTGTAVAAAVPDAVWARAARKLLRRGQAEVSAEVGTVTGDRSVLAAPTAPVQAATRPAAGGADRRPAREGGARRSAAARGARPATDFDAAVTTDLVPAVRGPVLRGGDPGYDEERAGHNTVVDHHPAVVVGATGPADVMAAVAFAARHDLPVGVLATGHTASVPADGAVLISTRRMQGVRIDPFARIARVEAGVRWERVIHEAAAFGLAPVSGSSTSVGAVGYTLGGGLGLLGRAFGYAADHVRDLDVVTAPGALRQVNARQFDDLFWALRGGKGNFGVVTSMEFALFPVARLYGGGLYFRGSAAAEVLNAYRRWLRDVPEQMSSSVALNRFPWDPALPAALRGRFTVHVRVAYHGTADDGAELVRPLRRVAVPLLDTVVDMPYTAAGRIHDDPTEPLPLYENTAFLRDLDEDAVDALVDMTGPDTTCPLRFVELRQLGGALSRQPEVPNAVSHRDAGFLLYAAGVAGVDPVREYARLLLGRMAPWCTGGVSVNFLGADDVAEQRVRTAYSPEDYRRLVAVKRAYDPANVFRINHNIPPAPATGPVTGAHRAVTEL